VLKHKAHVAANRFGYGASIENIAHINDSPENWLQAQLRAEKNKPISKYKPESASVIQHYHQENIKMSRSGKSDARKKMRETMRQRYVSDMQNRILRVVESDHPFIERLTQFWSNHFAISIRKGSKLHGFVNFFETEAIRPNILNNFSDMLIASTQHPCMLFYLDNLNSIGPKSFAGKRRDVGLNENLAREILELHTLGVQGGYRQRDVESLARMITGWTMSPEGEKAGEFSFNKRQHEPGAQTLLSKRFANGGVEQGVKALEFLAIHPATARHLSFKLARHFIADDPPQVAVDALTATWIRTNGNLQQVYQTLLALPAVWDKRFSKIKTPYDYLISTAKLAHSAADKISDDQAKFLLESLKHFGWLPFSASSPEGFPDTAVEVSGPDDMLRRTQWALAASGKFSWRYPASVVAETIFTADLLSHNTKKLIMASATPQEAWVLLLASPEFQRR